MINLEKHNRFNYLQINKSFTPVIGGEWPLLTNALENLGLEWANSKFTTDFDFFIAENNDVEKNKYCGKPIYLADDVIKSLLSGRQQNLQCPTFHDEYLPMLLSRDPATAALGYDLTIMCFNYIDWAHISFLQVGKIYPYSKLFYFSDFYARTVMYKNCKNIHSLFSAHYYSQRLKDPDDVFGNFTKG